MTEQNGVGRSGTERLRELLDERGVEYETYIEPLTGFEHVKWNFNEHGSADFNLEFGEPWLVMYGAISGPEQAVEATLGRGTCRMVLAELRGPAYTDTYECSECGEEVMVGIVMGESEPPKWCPNCGRRVVSE